MSTRCMYMNVLHLYLLQLLRIRLQYFILMSFHFLILFEACKMHT